MLLYLLLLATSSQLPTTHSQALECPALCTCDTLDMEVDCSNLGLTSPPVFTLPQENLRRLILDNNHLSGVLLMGPLLEKLPDLEELSIKSNQLVGVNFDGLGEGVKLERLWLDSNSIGELSELTNLRLVLPSLRELSLVKNELLVCNLAYLSREALSAAVDEPPLELLDLSGNKMSGMSPGVEGGGTPLPYLHQLHLDHNQLTSLTPNLTALAPALREIHANDNRIKAVSQQAVATLSQLSLLDLRENAHLPCVALEHLPWSGDDTEQEEERFTVLYDWCVQGDGSLVYPPGASTPPPPTPTEPTQCHKQLGYFPRESDRYVSGTLLQLINGVSSVDMCERECSSFATNQPCGAYTFSDTTKHCYIWASGATLSTSMSRATSAIRGLFSRYWLVDVKHGSQLSGFVHSGSFDACEAHCLYYQQCTAYTWHVDGRCYVYTGYVTLSYQRPRWNTALRH